MCNRRPSTMVTWSDYDSSSVKAAGSTNPEKKGPALLDTIRAVGEPLAAEGETVGIVVVGGAALIQGGTASRLTEHVDIIAAALSSPRASPARRREPSPGPPTGSVAQSASIETSAARRGPSDRRS